MKLMRRAEFLRQHEGTIYAKGGEMYFDGLAVKAETIGLSVAADGHVSGDWVYLDPCWIEAAGAEETFARLAEMLETGSSSPMAESYGRDGGFDQDAIFLVFERPDLERLRSLVDAAIAASESAGGASRV